jgi:hypothetical protein
VSVLALALLGGMALSPTWDAASGWQELRLGRALKPNVYEVEAAQAAAAGQKGQPALLRVRSQASMSLWARPVQVDLASWPVLCWRWRISAPLQGADMGLKAGDDYAARVYVAFRVPPDSLSWVTRAQLSMARRLHGDAVPDAALNYVWDNRQPVGHHAPNAYTAQTRMVVQRSGAAQAGEWVQERRDLLADAKQWLPPGARVTSIAVTADTDNTGESVVAEFADLKFVQAGAACP